MLAHAKKRNVKILFCSVDPKKKSTARIRNQFGESYKKYLKLYNTIHDGGDYSFPVNYDENNQPGTSAQALQSDNNNNIAVNNNAQPVIPVEVSQQSPNMEYLDLPAQHGEGTNNNNTDNHNISLRDIHTTYNQRFRLHSKIYTFKFQEYDGEIPLEEFLLSGFNEMIRRVTFGAAPDDILGIKIECENDSSKPMGLSYRTVVTVSGEMILDLLNSVSQSNAIFSVTDTLLISVTRITLPNGGYVNLAHCSDAQLLQRKNESILHTGPSNDFLCLPKAILLGKAWVDNDGALLNRYLRDHQFLVEKAENLCREARVTVTSIGCNMFSVYKLQRMFLGYTIYVYDEKRNTGNKTFCKAGSGPREINLFYLKDMQHFVAIRSRKGFYSQAYECQNCRFLYRGATNHMCKSKCTQCRGNVVCADTAGVSCLVCIRTFFNDECYRKHLEPIQRGFSVCENVFFCRGCQNVIELTHRRNRTHLCNEIFCKLCWIHDTQDHRCYVRPYTKQLPQKFVIIFFDLECMQSENAEGVRKHVPNLAVSSQVCEKCVNDAMLSEDYHCTYCENNKLNYFWNDSDEDPNTVTCVRKFIDYLESSNRPVTVMCHNFKGYDSHFILEEMAKQSSPITVALNGWKVMVLRYKNIRFVDSFNYMTIPLASFPKTFDLGNIMKGFYPHLMNTVALTNYVGVRPAREMYGVENFSKEKLREFDEWYITQEHVEFDNVAQLLDYCIMDVVILKRGALKFMKLFRELLNINPFLEAVTLPSAAMLGFRKNFLKPNQLGIVPKNEYAGNKMQSIIGRKWLEYENRKVHRTMIFEYKVPRVGVYVDGFVYSHDPNVKSKIYELFGCHFHSCVHCYFRQPSQYKPVIQTQRESVERRVERLKAAGYEVITEWECIFRKFLKTHPDLDKSLSSSTFVLHAPIKCRDAVYGGIVDVFRTYYKVAEGEKIRALDFKSLYPYTNKYGAYPRGHPRVYRGPECLQLDFDNIYGIVKLRILPPQKLYHPVLPIRVDSRLILGNCMACMTLGSPVCNHSERERSIIGTWVISEVHLAVSKGYRIIELIEIWEYDSEVIDPVTFEGGVFTEYVNLFLKVKEHSSDWPRQNMTFEEKNEYVENFLTNEGIVLDPDLVASNPPLRSISKGTLNSLWGKFGENSVNRSSTTVFKNPEKFFEHIARPDVDVIDVVAFGEGGVFVNWKINDALQAEPIKHGVVPVGAFTTSYGRMCLYNVLDILHENDVQNNVALYVDTDSIFYIERPNKTYDLPIGDGLGQLTNMLEEYGSNAYITEFVAIGPKAYSYKVFNPDTQVTVEVSKCKGIAGSVTNANTLNFENLKNLVNNNQDVLTFTNESKIKRKQPFTIITDSEQKNIKFTYSKRVITHNNVTVPYGYFSTRD